MSLWLFSCGFFFFPNGLSPGYIHHNSIQHSFAFCMRLHANGGGRDRACPRTPAPPPGVRKGQWSMEGGREPAPTGARMGEDKYAGDSGSTAETSAASSLPRGSLGLPLRAPLPPTQSPNPKTQPGLKLCGRWGPSGAGEGAEATVANGPRQRAVQPEPLPGTNSPLGLPPQPVSGSSALRLRSARGPAAALGLAPGAEL